MASDDQLLDIHRPMPDEGHDFLRRTVEQALAELKTNVVSVDDLTAGLSALAELAEFVFSQLDASLADREQLNSRIGVLEARKVTLAAKSTALPVLAIGSTVDVTVTWGKNLGDANYQVEFLLDAPLLGKVVPTLKTTYATSCVVTVRSAVAVALGQSLDAIASRYA